jgi:CBS domain-containing protein
MFHNYNTQMSRSSTALDRWSAADANLGQQVIRLDERRKEESNMKVKDLLTRELATIDARASISEAAKTLADNDVGMLPVLSSDDRVPVGTLTDRDIVVRGLAKGIDLTREPVERVMSPGVVACAAEASVEDASKLMRDRRIRRLLVTGKDETVQGVVSVGDLAIASKDPNLVADTLKTICK